MALVLGAVAGVGQAADPVEFKVGDFEFDRPAEWGWVVPGSPMRKAQLATPDEGEVTFFHFGPGQGGSVQQNIQRWVNQFDGGATGSKGMQREETYGETKVTYVTASGTFNSGMPGGPTTPMANYGLLGAILESEGGDVFVKMTGPDEAVKNALGTFETMIEGAATGD